MGGAAVSLVSRFLVAFIVVMDAWQRLAHPRTDWLAR